MAWLLRDYHHIKKLNGNHWQVGDYSKNILFMGVKKR
jgi:hypothetical protein